MYCDGPTAIKAAVAQQMGVGMMFEESLKADVDVGKFKILEVPGLHLAGESYIIYSQSRPISSLAQEFLTLIRSAVAQEASTVVSGGQRRNLPVRRRRLVADKHLA